MPPSFGAHASAGSASTEPDQCHRVQSIPDACLSPRCRAPQSLRLDPGSQNLLRNDKASGQFPHRARTRPARHVADRAAHRLQNLRIGCTQLLSCTLQTRFVAMQINHCCCTTSASNASNPIPVPSGWALVTTSWGRAPDLDDIAPGDILHILPFSGQARLIGVQLILSQFRIQVGLIEDRPHLARLPRLQPQRGLDGKVIRVKEGIDVLPNSVH